MTELEDLYPLSPTQQGMLFHALQEPNVRPYTEQLVWELTGEVDLDRLGGAWQALVDRHPVLRTSLVWEETDTPLQAVHQTAQLSYMAFDWTAMSPADQREHFPALVDGYRSYGLDLRSAPLMKVAVVKLAPARHRLVWTFHHTAIDGWSVALLRRELLEAYRTSAITGPPPRPYRDFIAWLGARDPVPGEAFWRAHLEDVAEPTRFPVLGQGGQGEGHAHSEVDLGAAETERLERAARGLKVTLNTLVQGAWALLTSRYTGQRDVVFGVTSSGRPPALPGAEGMVGTFIVTTPLRVRLSGDETLGAWLRDLQRFQYEAREHEHTPLADLQAWTQVPPGEPLFDSVLVFENHPEPDDPREPGQPELTALEFVDRTNYPLALTVLPRRQLGLRLTYERTRGDEAGAARLLGHLRRVLTLFHEDAESHPVVDLPLRSEQERTAWERANDTAVALPEGVVVTDLVRRQATRAPTAVAVQDGHRSLSYADLTERAGRLASHLRGLGAGPGTLVGVGLDRSVDMVVALLAVLDSGAGYVPLDPAHPRERLDFVLRDSGPVAVLATAASADRFAGSGVRVVRLDGEWWTALPAASTLPVAQDGTAYVIYTSGSTGRPKGVQVPHRALLNLLLSITASPGLDDHDVLLAVTTLSFDIAALEVFGPLIVGGRVVLVPSEVAVDGARLAAALDECSATVLQATPTTWKLLLAAGWQGADLKALSGGEALPGELARELLARVGSLWNLYGPTETTIWSTVHRVAAGDAPVPLGRPIANTRIHVLDAHGQPQPPGIAGELHIAGAGLAGYWRDEVRTRERFPVARGERLYRTGDLGSYGADGLLRWHGRVDEQVKVRGHRIEPGEVETHLRRHPGVADCAVVARDHGDGDRVLVAYVVPSGTAPAAGELRALLLRTLPAYLVPSVFVDLPRLPTTPNGKVDRRRLPPPDGVRPRLSQEHVPPSGATEQALAEVWAEVLGLDRVGVHDNFFELGGDSLRTVRVMTKALHRGLRITVGDVFDKPTIRQLADAVAAEQGTDAPIIARRVHEQPAPITSGQEMMLALTGLTPGTTAYVPRAAFDLRGALDDTALLRALDGLVARHGALRTTFHVDDEGRLGQRLGPLAAARVERFDLTAVAEEELESALAALVAEHVAVAFDHLSGEPLYRIVLARLRSDRHLLCIAMDHLVSDGWSLMVLSRDLHELYRAECEGDAADLPELPVEYVDFAVWQREYMAGHRLDRYRDFWRARLSGVPPMQVPSTRPPSKTTNRRGIVEQVRIAPDVVAGLAGLARREQTTLFVALIAAVQVVIWSRVDDDIVTVAAPVGGRNYPEIEQMVGCFVHGLLLPTDLSGDPTLREVVVRVRDRVRDTYDHQDMPLKELADIREFSVVNGMGTQGVALEMTPAAAATELPAARGGVLSALPYWPLRVGEVDMPPVDLFLNLHASPVDAGLEGECVYNPVRFDGVEIRALLDQLQRILRALAFDPGVSISALHELPVS